MTTLIGNDLVSKLRLRQVAECLSDRQFAKKLGVSHQLWQMTRTGKRDIHLVLLEAAVRAYPVLNRDVLLFLAGPGEAIKPSENAGESFLGRWLRKLLLHLMAGKGGR